jgi:hypothetical protein
MPPLLLLVGGSREREEGVEAVGVLGRSAPSAVVVVVVLLVVVVVEDEVEVEVEGGPMCSGWAPDTCCLAGPRGLLLLDGAAGQ